MSSEHDLRKEKSAGISSENIIENSSGLFVVDEGRVASSMDKIREDEKKEEDKKKKEEDKKKINDLLLMLQDQEGDLFEEKRIDKIRRQVKKVFDDFGNGYSGFTKGIKIIFNNVEIFARVNGGGINFALKEMSGNVDTGDSNFIFKDNLSVFPELAKDYDGEIPTEESIAERVIEILKDKSKITPLLEALTKDQDQ